MPAVMREGPRVLTIIRKLVARRVTQHVRVNWERKLRSLAGSLHHPQELSCRWGCLPQSQKSRGLSLAVPAERGAQAV
jgi:hypothetical protein